VLVHAIPTSPALWRHVLPAVPGARMQTVARGRRLLPEDRPAEVAAAIRRVLERAA
jgi:hypothetical protein